MNTPRRSSKKGKKRKSGSNAPVGRAVLYIDGKKKPFHLTNLWKSDTDGVILSGKTGAEYVDEALVDALDNALDRGKDIRLVIFEPYDENERKKKKRSRRDDEEYEDEDIEDGDEEEEEEDDIPF